MQETAAQVLVRTSQRWYQIRHLEPAIRKHLMSLPEEEFTAKLRQLTRPVA